MAIVGRKLLEAVPTTGELATVGARSVDPVSHGNLVKVSYHGLEYEQSWWKDNNEITTELSRNTRIQIIENRFKK